MDECFPTGNEKWLTDESDIVWLRDRHDLPYVRESACETFSRRIGKPKPEQCNHHTLIGYSELRPKARHNRIGKGSFTRRLFWVKESDLLHSKHRSCLPTEAVDPLTITPGVKGRMTEACRHRVRAEALAR